MSTMTIDRLADRTYRGVFAPGELTILNVYPPDDYDPDASGGDTWANVLHDTLHRGADAFVFAAPDFDGTTGGNPAGINVLVPTADVPLWTHAAEALGGTAEIARTPITAGRYGDGGYAGVLLLADEQDNRYWFE